MRACMLALGVSDLGCALGAVCPMSAAALLRSHPTSEFVFVFSMDLVVLCRAPQVSLV